MDPGLVSFEYIYIYRYIYIYMTYTWTLTPGPWAMDPGLVSCECKYILWHIVVDIIVILCVVQCVCISLVMPSLINWEHILTSYACNVCHITTPIIHIIELHYMLKCMHLQYLLDWGCITYTSIYDTCLYICVYMKPESVTINNVLSKKITQKKEHTCCRSLHTYRYLIM